MQGLIIIVLKPGPARRVDPGLEPVRVQVKTRRGVDLAKPGRPGTRATRVNPTETRSFFFYIYTNVKLRRFDILFFYS